MSYAKSSTPPATMRIEIRVPASRLVKKPKRRKLGPRGVIARHSIATKYSPNRFVSRYWTLRKMVGRRRLELRTR
jgi:hypothetical protein